MGKAHRNEQIVFNGETIMLFHDLSHITLKIADLCVHSWKNGEIKT